MADWITRDKKCICVVTLATPSQYETELLLGTQISVGDTVTYTCGADGGYCIVYDADGKVLDQYIAPTTSSQCMRGGSVPVTNATARIVLGPTLSATKSASVTVGDLVDAAASLDELYATLARQCFSDTDMQQIVNLYLAGSGGSSGKDGITYVPHLADNGDLSWSNTGGLENPTTVNIRGPKGEPGPVGSTPTKGIDYWTPTDKAEIVADVLASLPYGDEVSY